MFPVLMDHLLLVFVRIRVAGIKGLQGVVRKTVNDELQAIIWEPQHMDKLIPSMLFNMQDSEELDRYTESPSDHGGVKDCTFLYIESQFWFKPELGLNVQERRCSPSTSQKCCRFRWQNQQLNQQLHQYRLGAARCGGSQNPP